MAHLPQDELPSEFNVVVDGTGLVQSILAAALARAGKSVLHVDRNTYYGELWGSLMYREMQQWMKDCRSHDQEATPPESRDDPQATPPEYTPAEGERVIEIDRTNTPCSATNLVELTHTEKLCTEPPTEAPPTEAPPTEALPNEAPPNESPPTEAPPTEPPPAEAPPTEAPPTEAPPTEAPPTEAPPTEAPPTEPPPTEAPPAEAPPTEAPPTEAPPTEAPPTEAPPTEAPPTEAPPAEAPPTDSQISKVTWQSLEPQWRRFNFDLLPKFLYCRGAMVELISESSCSRYTEFRAVGGIFNYSDGKIEQVPCSRSDVFSSKAVSMLEKRKMMKFLTFCTDYQQHPDEYKEFVSLPYMEFLKLKQLTPNLVQYILHSIAMVTENTSTLEGLQATQLFLNSLGRYGNVPFLFPVFGGGELPQAFCRLCAVYGGVYCLHRHVTSLVTSTSEDKITSVICSSGQQIKCSAVVLSAAFLTKTLDFRDTVKITKLSRAIFVIDSPIPGTEGKLSLITLTPGSLHSTQNVTIRVVQLDHLSNSCPQGTYMVHMQCSSECATAQQDLQPAAQALFSVEDATESNSSGPRLLWSLYYNVDLHNVDQSHASSIQCPSNLYLTSEPDATIGYESAAKEARELFTRLYPGEEFLPHPPSPEDIIYEDPANNHDNDEGATADSGADEGDAPSDQISPTDDETPTADSEAPPTGDEAPPTGDEATPTDHEATPATISIQTSDQDTQKD